MVRLLNQYVSVKSLMLIGVESMLILLSLVFAAKLRFWNQPVEFSICTRSGGFLLQAFLAFLVLVTCCYYNDLYDLSAIRDRGNEFIRLAQALGTSCILLGLLSITTPSPLGGRGTLFIAVAFAAVTIGGVRVSLSGIWQSTSRQRNVLILGDGDMALTTAREIERRRDLNFRVIAFVAPEVNDRERLLGRPILQGMSGLCRVARDRGVSRIVVALDDSGHALPAHELDQLRVEGVVVEDAHSALSALTGRIWLHAASVSSAGFSEGFHRSKIVLRVKRTIDLASGFLGIVLFSPLMALIAIAIRLDSAGPVFYRQARVGLRGRVFEVLKFRSMRVDAEAKDGAQWAQKDDPRTTRVGRVIRKYRLDELPQFINVIRGEMSFVGPRPERPVFVEQLRARIPLYDKRHSVRPGVTGWAQVKYAYGASVEDAFRKLEYDLFYVKTYSILFDIAIVFRTVRVVLFGCGR